MEIPVLTGERVYLMENLITNCQSLRRIHYKFTKGLNVIVARNNTGKSVFFKLLKLCASEDALDAKERKALVSFWAEYAESAYLFSDGSMGAIRIFRNKIQYLYKRNVNDPETLVTTSPLEEFTRKLSLKYNPKDKFFANMLDQEQALFLVKSTSSANNGMMRMHTTDEELEAFVEKLQEQKTGYKEKLKQLDSVLLPLKFKIEAIEDVDIVKIENDIESLDVGLSLLEPLLEVAREFNDSMKNSKPLVDLSLWTDSLSFASESLSLLENLQVVDSVETEIDGLDLMLEIASAEQHLDLYHDTSRLEVDAVLEALITGAEHVSNLKIVENNTDTEELLDLAFAVSAVEEDVVSMWNNTCSVLERQISVNVMEKRVSELAERVECPIYGYVKHAYGVCVPDNNGPALEREKLPWS